MAQTPHLTHTFRKISVVSGIIALGLLATSCKQREFNGGEAQNIATSHPKTWQATGELFERTTKAFAELNPGYALAVDDLMGISADNTNTVGYLADKYRLRISKLADGSNAAAIVATTPIEIHTIFYCGETKNINTRGVFVEGKLIGFDGMICVDSMIGKKYCGETDSISFRMQGCTIGTTTSGQVITFKYEN